MILPNKITKEEINELPLGEFDGEVVIINKMADLREAIEELKDHEIVGFDTETKPTFKKGQFHHVALVQLAIDHKAFLFRLNHVGFDDALRRYFEIPDIYKIGVGLRDDLRALKMLSEFEPANFIDLNTEAKNLGILNEGARNLTAMFLGFRISKSAQTSNWENPELSEKQIRYAATDAWVCYRIYQEWLQRGVIGR